MDDMLFSFTEWLRSTFLVDFALWISDTSVSFWMVTHFWFIPIMQVIHILAIAASFASVLMIAARIYGVAGHASLADTGRLYSKVLWVALAVLIVTGLGMITSEPVRELINPYFWIKMGLVVVGIVVSIWFAAHMKRRLGPGERRAVTSGGAVVDKGVQTADTSLRITAAFLVILWCMIMYCGRFIAYAPV